MAKKTKAAPRVAEAAGASAAGNVDAADITRRAEEAMSKAAAQAQSEGVTDPEEIKAAMLAARDKALEG